MFLVLLIVGIVSAARIKRSPVSEDADATVLNQDLILNGDGSYSFNYETSNGIKAAQRSEDGINVKGEFSYRGVDGNEYQVSYVADERGFQPRGAHLPLEPPAPDYVIEMLEDLRATNNEDFDLAALDAAIARLKATHAAA
ncbi:cuticle protein CP14.6-like isoform X2 [Wyeomyia smithii]|uniref:cuticle protein CP14.6-like isoform X2 n=1 Tax=Wyeomyia smithii TaxID=174621 RepID=UPI002467D9F6|nr:cuticle protein CP14.6-like isoform X2 [Wyeomyia smithii]